MNFNQITIVNIDGRWADLIETQLALVKSGLELPGAKILLLSPKRPTYLLDGIEHITIEPISYFEYNLFVIYSLHYFISTEFALIVQSDGWVLNGKNWNNDFFNYDYIGAPSHAAKVISSNHEGIFEGFTWKYHKDDPSKKIQVVMNGGFSLRSKKLLKAPTKLSIPYSIPPVSQITPPHYKMRWKNNLNLEDVQLSLVMRDQLEKHGIKYAPTELANVLGHHSKYRKISSLNPLELKYAISKKQSELIFGEPDIIKLFFSYGYKVILNSH